MRLEISNLSKSFVTEKGEVIDALSNVNLVIDEQEFICIVGPSGCGKTTLLRIIGGLDTATMGTVKLDGQVINGPTPQMAMIFQEYSLYPWRTVIDNVAFGLELRGVSKDDRYRHAKSYLDLVGLTGFEEHYSYELSGGMRQRVAVARALAIEPKVLLMDEPFGALDAQTRNRLQNELLQIWEKAKKTVIFVTHSVDEAVFLGDRIVALTKRPGTVKEIVPIIHCKPRDRTCSEFVAIRKHVLELIAEESSGTS